jgi:hypothetical protein
MKGVILAKALLLFSFEVFSFDCDAGFWDSVPCVMKNNDFVFSFSQIRRFQFLICNGGEEIEREKRNSAIQLYMCLIIQKL